MTDDGGSPERLYSALRTEIDKVLIGNEAVVEGLTIALLVRGHVLLEGVPGVAKTTIANLFAQALDLSYSRIQMTPDVLPADITGTHIYRESTESFELQRGPVFANVVVADEINRATPKTQSALLEAMQESTVTIEGEQLALPDPFVVVATQNPIEMEGTFSLPAAQRDRFVFKHHVDSPSAEDELTLLERFDEQPDLGPADVDTVVSEADVRAARTISDEVYVAPSVKTYIRDVVRETRQTDAIRFGASPRAGLQYLRAAKARAAIRGRDFVTPDDVKSLADPVLNHRLVLSTDAELRDLRPADVIADVLDSVETPSSPDVSPATN